MQTKKKNFRKRSIQEDEGDDPTAKSDDENDMRLALEEVKFLQQQGERKSGIPAIPTLQTAGIVSKVTEKVDADGEKGELVLQIRSRNRCHGRGSKHVCEKRNSKESSTQWTTWIAEVQLPIEYKLRNIEETEAAKKLLQEKWLTGWAKSEVSIPSKHPELYKDKGSEDDNAGSRPTDTSSDTPGSRQNTTDQFMLERFRKQERQRVMRR
ncbi:hypothetical protein PTKIN_Ptkin15bG0064000 [Pterospermum kingtungense]